MNQTLKPQLIRFRNNPGKKACMPCEKQVHLQGATTCPTCGEKLAYFNYKMRLPKTGHPAGWRKLREFLEGPTPLLWRYLQGVPRDKRKTNRILPRMGRAQW